MDSPESVRKSLTSYRPLNTVTPRAIPNDLVPLIKGSEVDMQLDTPVTVRFIRRSEKHCGTGDTQDLVNSQYLCASRQVLQHIEHHHMVERIEGKG